MPTYQQLVRSYKILFIAVVKAISLRQTGISSQLIAEIENAQLSETLRRIVTLKKELIAN